MYAKCESLTHQQDIKKKKFWFCIQTSLFCFLRQYLSTSIHPSILPFYPSSIHLHMHPSIHLYIIYPSFWDNNWVFQFRQKLLRKSFGTFFTLHVSWLIRLLSKWMHTPFTLGLHTTETCKSCAICKYSEMFFTLMPVSKIFCWMLSSHGN